jgi:tetratricopeptide (TPR) repeat protein
VEAPAGTLLWSQAMQASVEDLFQVQDRIAHAVVTALSVPISTREHRLMHRDVPANPEAYGAYLRANRLIDSTSQWQEARELYAQAVELDPQYAPAWARFARCLRMLGKYGEGPQAHVYVKDAERAFGRAFELNPDLSIAHNLYTYAEVETGRASDAMVRLLDRLRRRSSDPELYAGLVQACRYCGLLDASIAADAHARRLDPGIITSAAHSFFLSGNYEKAIARDTDNPPYLTLLALILTGRRAKALSDCQAIDLETLRNRRLALLVRALRATLEGQREDGLAALRELSAPGFADPEGWYYWSLLITSLGDHAGAIEHLRRAVDSGWCCSYAIENSPALDPLRADPLYRQILDRAQRAQTAAAQVFAAADGPRLLGLK